MNSNSALNIATKALDEAKNKIKESEKLAKIAHDVYFKQKMFLDNGGEYRLHEYKDWITVCEKYESVKQTIRDNMHKHKLIIMKVYKDNPPPAVKQELAESIEVGNRSIKDAQQKCDTAKDNYDRKLTQLYDEEERLKANYNGAVAEFNAILDTAKTAYSKWLVVNDAFKRAMNANSLSHEWADPKTNASINSLNTTNAERRDMSRIIQEARNKVSGRIVPSEPAPPGSGADTFAGGGMRRHRTKSRAKKAKKASKARKTKKTRTYVR
jgi:hypothetical protein